MRVLKTFAGCGLIIALALVSGSQVEQREASAQTVTPGWSLTGNLNTARYGHTATLLPNGKVLVAGGAVVSCAGAATNRLSSTIRLQERGVTQEPS